MLHAGAAEHVKLEIGLYRAGGAQYRRGVERLDTLENLGETLEGHHVEER